MAQGMHKMRLGRSLASLIGEGEGSEFEVEGQRNVALDAIKAGRFNPRRNFSEAQIEELAARFYGRPMRVQVSASDAATAGSSEAPGATAAELTSAAMQDPAVQAAVSILGGEIAEVRERRPRRREEP